MLKVFNRSAASGPLAVVDALQAELQLLREENARLRTAGQRAGAMPTVDRLAAALGEADQVLALQKVANAAADAADEAWQTLASALVLRDALVGVCDELVRVAGQLRERLQGLSAWPTYEGPPAPAPSDPLVDAAVADGA